MLVLILATDGRYRKGPNGYYGHRPGASKLAAMATPRRGDVMFQHHHHHHHGRLGRCLNKVAYQRGHALRRGLPFHTRRYRDSKCSFTFSRAALKRSKRPSVSANSHPVLSTGSLTLKSRCPLSFQENTNTNLTPRSCLIGRCFGEP